MGRLGAVGKTYRTHGICTCALIDAHPCPLSPSPCNQTMLAVCDFLGSTTTGSGYAIAACVRVFPLLDPHARPDAPLPHLPTATRMPKLRTTRSRSREGGAPTLRRFVDSLHCDAHTPQWYSGENLLGWSKDHLDRWILGGHPPGGGRVWETVHVNTCHPVSLVMEVASWRRRAGKF